MVFTLSTIHEEHETHEITRSVVCLDSSRMPVLIRSRAPKWLQLLVAGYKIHNCLYVTFKLWTTNSVRRQQRGRLSCIVCLIEEEIRDRRMRQVSDLW